MSGATSKADAEDQLTTGEAPASSSSSGSLSASKTTSAASGIERLPNELLMHIMSFLSFDEVAHLRLVCRTFNTVASSLLNIGFYRIGRSHADALDRIKAQLPRRESERKMHRLSQHNDILMSIESRLSLLGIAYGKYMERGICCFIPGRVLDEVRRVVHLVNRREATRQALGRPHEVLQELRDISSMAIEHFDECIVPTLRTRLSSMVASRSADSGSFNGHTSGCLLCSLSQGPLGPKASDSLALGSSALNWLHNEASSRKAPYLPPQVGGASSTATSTTTLSGRPSQRLLWKGCMPPWPAPPLMAPVNPVVSRLTELEQRFTALEQKLRSSQKRERLLDRKLSEQLTRIQRLERQLNEQIGGKSSVSTAPGRQCGMPLYSEVRDPDQVAALPTSKSRTPSEDNSELRMADDIGIDDNGDGRSSDGSAAKKSRH